MLTPGPGPAPPSPTPSALPSLAPLSPPPPRCPPAQARCPFPTPSDTPQPLAKARCPPPLGLVLPLPGPRPLPRHAPSSSPTVLQSPSPAVPQPFPAPHPDLPRPAPRPRSHSGRWCLAAASGRTLGLRRCRAAECPLRPCAGLGLPGTPPADPQGSPVLDGAGPHRDRCLRRSRCRSCGPVGTCSRPSAPWQRCGSLLPARPLPGSALREAAPLLPLLRVRSDSAPLTAPLSPSLSGRPVALSASIRGGWDSPSAAAAAPAPAGPARPLPAADGLGSSGPKSPFSCLKEPPPSRCDVTSPSNPRGRGPPCSGAGLGYLMDCAVATRPVSLSQYPPFPKDDYSWSLWSSYLSPTEV